MSLDLHFKQQGNGPAVILLHGLFGSISNLQSIARELENNFSVYSVDHRNHGHSPHTEVMDYPQMANDILDFMDQQNIHQPVLIGHSMGGKVAMLTSLLHPHTIRKLIILDIAPVTYQRSYEAVFTAMKKIDLQSIQSRAEADFVLEHYFKNTDFRQFLLQNLLHTENGYEWRLNLPVLIKNISNIVGWPELSDMEYNQPALFIGGKESDFILPEHEADIMNLFPKAHIEMLEAASHWLHAEQPEKTRQLIRDFLQE